jgi:predicted flap endonuclease-1-like 5' DNA nuclease
MNSIILQTQSISGAAFEIIIMLLGAAIIGVITTYLYCRTVFNKRLVALKAELEESKKNSGELKKTVDNLNAQIAEKEKTIDALGNEKNQLEIKANDLQKALEDLRSKYDKATIETSKIAAELHQKEDTLKEKEAILKRISERKKEIDYTSFGKAAKHEKDDLKMISGIGSFIEQKLNALDIFTFKQISKFSKKDIKEVNKAIEYFPGRIERDEWVAQAKELLYSGQKKSQLLDNIRKRKNNINYDRIGVAQKDEADDLTVISGIGGWIQKKLNALDIYTYKQIANFNKEDEKSVSEAIEFFPGRINRDEWVPQAQELVYSGGKRTALFERMKKKKHKIDYSLIGIAHPEDAQDLQQIKGIGPYIQEKLNFLGIYTFGQISKFTPVDIETISEIIEFFPGRIQRDDWIGQAKKIMEAKS